MEILQNFGLAILGLLIYVLWQVKDHLARFDINIFWKDNKPFWIWAVLMQTALIIVAAIDIESLNAITETIGFQIGVTGSWIMSGWLMAKTANAASEIVSKNKIGRKQGTVNPNPPPPPNPPSL